MGLVYLIIATFRLQFVLNVSKYSIHGAYGFCLRAISVAMCSFFVPEDHLNLRVHCLLGWLCQLR